MNMFSSYFKDREKIDTLEHPFGFALYQIDQTTVYLRDIYVVPNKRKTRIATEIADAVSEIGIAAGCTKLLGSICPTDPNATTNLKVLLSYGFSLLSCNEKLILFSKEI